MARLLPLTGTLGRFRVGMAGTMCDSGVRTCGRVNETYADSPDLSALVKKIDVALAGQTTVPQPRARHRVFLSPTSQCGHRSGGDWRTILRNVTATK